MLQPWLNLLTCPAHDSVRPGALRAEDDALRCDECDVRYPIVDGIVDMLPPPVDSDESKASEIQQWDMQAETYEIERARDATYMAGVRAAARELAPRPGDLILEAACGTGMITRRWRRPGMRTVCFDLSMRSLARLKNRLDDESALFVRGDVSQLPFVSGAFDRVLCANMIQHVQAPARLQCVRQLARVTRPNGRVVVTAHSYSIQKQRAGWFKEGAAVAYAQEIQYIYRFEPGEFRELLGTALKVNKVCGAGLPLPYRFKLSWLARIAESILSRSSLSAPFGYMLVGTCTARGSRISDTKPRPELSSLAA